MRVLALISLASCLALAACGPDGDDQTAIPPSNQVEIDPCVGHPNTVQCREAEARDACSESADQNACVANYLDNYPAAAPKTLPEPAEQ